MKPFYSSPVLELDGYIYRRQGSSRFEDYFLCKATMNRLWEIDSKTIQAHAYKKQPHKNAIPIWIRKNNEGRIFWSRGQRNQTSTFLPGLNAEIRSLKLPIGKIQQFWVEVELLS